MAQLVARYLGVVEAAGSSPVTQTKKSDMPQHVGFLNIVEKRKALKMKLSFSGIQWVFPIN